MDNDLITFKTIVLGAQGTYPFIQGLANRPSFWGI